MKGRLAGVEWFSKRASRAAEVRKGAGGVIVGGRGSPFGQEAARRDNHQ